MGQLRRGRLTALMKALPALEKSVPAVKADAARELFKVKCNEITWAVIDSGTPKKARKYNEAESKSISRLTS